MKATKFARVGTILIGASVMLAGACSTNSRRFLSAAELEQAPSFRALVERVTIENLPEAGLLVVVDLRKEDGERIAFGEHRQGKRAAEAEHRATGGRSPIVSEATVRLVADFARTLQKGKSYEFPAVWLEYRKGVRSEPALDRL